MYEEELDLQHPLFSVHGYDEKKVSRVISKQHCAIFFDKVRIILIIQF